MSDCLKFPGSVCRLAPFTMLHEDVERIVMEEFGRLEARGTIVKQDCDVTLARAVGWRVLEEMRK